MDAGGGVGEVGRYQGRLPNTNIMQARLVFARKDGAPAAAQTGKRAAFRRQFLAMQEPAPGGDVSENSLNRREWTFYSLK